MQRIFPAQFLRRIRLLRAVGVDSETRTDLDWRESRARVASTSEPSRDFLLQLTEQDAELRRRPFVWRVDPCKVNNSLLSIKKRKSC